MNRRTGRAGFGVPSIVLILTVTVLVIFTSLALVSANNDLKLTDKTINATAAYYKADNRAQEILAEADSLYAVGKSPDGVSGTQITNESGQYSFAVNIDKTRELKVSFRCSSTNLDVTVYKVVQKLKE